MTVAEAITYMQSQASDRPRYDVFMARVRPTLGLAGSLRSWHHAYGGGHLSLECDGSNRVRVGRPVPTTTEGV